MCYYSEDVMATRVVWYNLVVPLRLLHIVKSILIQNIIWWPELNGGILVVSWQPLHDTSLITSGRELYECLEMISNLILILEIKKNVLENTISRVGLTTDEQTQSKRMGSLTCDSLWCQPLEVISNIMYEYLDSQDSKKWTWVANLMLRTYNRETDTKWWSFKSS